MDDLKIQTECRQQLLVLEQATANILVGFANELKRRDPKVTEQSAVLYGAICKLQEGSAAIRLLSQHGYVDEMNVLLRTQVELSVNACYLQHAPDEELMSYMNHDSIAGLVALHDMERAHKNLLVPADLHSRVTKLANEASSASGLKVNSRTWDKKNLKKRADTIDEQTGQSDFASLLATVYVTGSGYVHGSYKTIHKHVRYLIAGEKDYPWHVMFGANNVLHGVGHVQFIVARYLAKRFDFDTERLNELATQAVHVCEVMNADYSSLKRAKGATRREMPEGGDSKISNEG